MAGEYGPIAFGASGAATASRTSRSLGDLARPQAARADPHPPRGAVDEGANGLQVGLEPARAHVVGMRDCPADHRTLTADFTTLGHDRLFSGAFGLIEYQDNKPS